ncbi:MAG: polar amino acid transport system substrate-binding protein [Thermoleophilaceae bacterium]|nr:polar amino acid transport system substrate-binding protein [Thermoleophilaceae bacterium]
MRATRHVAAIVVALSMSALVACGSDGDQGSKDSASGGPATATADSKVSAKLPADVRDRGTLRVATDPTYAPMEFVGDDGTIQGVDIDFAGAIAGVMGLKLTLQKATFDSILPGLQSGKHDIAMSGFSDTKEREQVVDFVTYLSAGTSFLVKASDGPDIQGLEDLCGHTVAVQKGTTTSADVEGQAKKCDITVRLFPDTNAAFLALSSGRADVSMADTPVVDYQVKKSNGQLKSTGEPYNTIPFGVAVQKGSGLAPAVQDALKVLVANGKHDAILEKWGVRSAPPFTGPQINTAAE